MRKIQGAYAVFLGTLSLCAAEEQYLSNIEQLYITTSKLEWVMSNFHTSRANFLPANIPAVRRLFAGGTELSVNQHISALAAACSGLESWASSTSSITVTEQLNIHTASLIQGLQGFTNFLYKNYQLYIENKSQTESFEWALVQKATMDGVPQLLDKIAASISTVPISIDLMLENFVNWNDRQLNDLLCDVDFSPLRATIATLNSAFAAKCNIAPPEIASATKSLLSTAEASIFTDFEHRTCIAEYVDSIVRIGSITSTLTLQLQKISCKAFVQHQDEQSIVDQIANITGAVDSIAQSIFAIAGDYSDCVMKKSFIAEIRNIEDQLQGCFSSVNALCDQCFQTSFSIPPPSTDHQLTDISGTLEKIIDDTRSIMQCIPQIYAKFGAQYQEDTGNALAALEGAVAVLVDNCAGEKDTSLLQTMVQHSNAVCLHKNITLGDFLHDITEIVSGFPTTDKRQCCSEIFNDMRDIHHHCFQTRRLLRTIAEAADMYQPNKHPAWVQIISMLQNFMSSILLADAIDPDVSDGRCHSERLKDYLALVNSQLATLTNSLDETVQSLYLPNFVMDFTPTYPPVGCDAITLFLNNIGDVTGDIYSLLDAVSAKIKASEYAVDAGLIDAVRSFAQSITDMLGQFDPNGQFGPKVPLVSALCQRCKSEASWDAIKSNLENLVFGLNNLASNELQTQLCCRGPSGVLINIGGKLRNLDKVIQALPIAVSNVTDDNGKTLVLEFNKATGALSAIREQLIAMQVAALEGESPCLMQRSLPKMYIIDQQMENLLNTAASIHSALGGAPIDFVPDPVFANDDFCTQFNNVFGFVQGTLSSLSGSIHACNEEFGARTRAFYSDELLESFDAFLTMFRQVQQQIGPVLGINLTCNHTNQLSLDELGSIDSNLADVKTTMRRFCCSSISESFDAVSTYLAHVEAMLSAVNQAYDTSFQLLGLEDALPGGCTQIRNTLNTIISARNEMLGNPCNLQKITPYFLALRSELGDSAAGIKSLLDMLEPIHSLLLLPTVKNPPYDNFSVSANAKTMADQYISCATTLHTLATTIRQSPPLQANQVELLALVQNARDMFAELGIVIAFLMEGFQTSPLWCDECTAIIFNSTTFANAQAAIVEDFNDIYDVIQHPGCCVPAADQVVATANLLRRITHALSTVADLPQILLHTSREQAFFASFDGWIAKLQALQDKISEAQSACTPVGSCVNNPLTQLIEVINTCIGNADVTELLEILGAHIDYSSLETIVPDRQKSGCEMLVVAIEDCANSLRQCKQLGSAICDVLLRASTRRHNPELLVHFNALRDVMIPICNAVTAIAQSVNSSELCPVCLTVRERQAISALEQHFAAFINYIVDGSPRSVNGILARYCSSFQNAAALNLLTHLRHLPPIIQSIASDDSLFKFSMDDGIIPVLSSLLETYSALAVLTSVEHECGGVDQFLPLLDAALKGLDFKFLELAKFLDIPVTEIVFSPPPTFYQAQSSITALACQCLGQISEHINQLVYKMNQRQVSYASNAKIIQILNAIINTPLDALISQAYKAFHCDYCDYSDSQIMYEFQKMKNALAALKQAFFHQTYLSEIEAVSFKIAQDAVAISQMCDEFLGAPNVKLVVNCEVEDQVEKIGTSLHSLKTFLYAALDDEILLENLQNLYDNGVVTLRSAAEQFIAIHGIECVPTVNTLILREMSIQEQIDLFYSAIAKVDESFAKARNIAKKLKVISYNHKLIQLTASVAKEIETFPASAFSLTHGLVTGTPQLATALSSLKIHAAAIASELGAKCCSEFYFHLRQMLHELQRCGSFSHSIVFNQNYLAMLLRTDEKHELLEYLCEPSLGLPAILSTIQSIRAEFVRTFQEGNISPEECVTPQIIPAIHRITEIAKEIANRSKTFYGDHNLGGDFVDIPEFSREAILCENDIVDEIILAIHKISDVFNYLNNIIQQPMYKMNSQLDAFGKMYEFLGNISQSLTHLHDLGINACPRCAPWPSVKIMAMAQLLNPSSVILEEAEVIGCCAAFTNETSLCAQRLAAFEALNNVILSHFESKIAPGYESDLPLTLMYPMFAVNFWNADVSVQNQHLSAFSQLVEHFTQYVNRLLPCLGGMTQVLLQHQGTNESCLSVICMPHMRELNGFILDLLQFTRNVTGRIEFDEFEPNLQASCADRKRNMQAIASLCDNIFARWNTFKDSWSTVHTLQYHDVLSEHIRQFATGLMQLRQNLADWESASNTAFCIACNDVPNGDAHIRGIEEIQSIFKSIADHADTCCPSILKLVVRNVRKNIFELAVIMRKMSENDHIFTFISESSNLWSNLLAKSSNLIQTVIDLEKLSFESGCPNHALNPILAQIDETVQQIRDAFGAFAVCDSSDRQDDSTGIATNLETLSVSWNALCGALDSHVPDELRVSFATAINQLNENLTALYDHIPSFKVFTEIVFCGGEGISEDITPNARESIRRMIFRTARLLPHLWAHNCCDVHAKFVYNAGKWFERINVNRALLTEGQLCRDLLTYADRIDQMQFKINMLQTEACLFSCLTWEFEQISDAMEQAVLNLPQLAYPDWDTLTSSTKNDCEALPDLYDDFTQQMSSTLTVFVESLTQADQRAVFTAISGLKSVQTSLRGLAQTMLNYEGTRGTLCQSCQHSSVICGINQIIELLDITTQQLHVIVHRQILRELAQDDTVQLVQQYFDADEGLWTPMKEIRHHTDCALSAANALHDVCSIAPRESDKVAYSFDNE
jgi:hypothetical protein